MSEATPPATTGPVPAGAAHLEAAWAHYLDDRLEEARVELEAAYRAQRSAGDARGAARSAIVVAELQTSELGRPAVGAGWLARARRLLDGVGRCVEEGYLELAFVACERPDVDALERSAERALALAVEFGDIDLEVRALADGGLALVSQGRVAAGLARLDEAMAAIAAGEVRQPMMAGTSFCAMLTSCERTGDVARAEDWVRALTDLLLDPLGGRPVVLHTHCRLAFGSVLVAAGRWVDAERAVLDALGPSASRSLGHRREAVARLAELRVLQGRVEEAAEVLAPYEDVLCASGPLAQVHLARNEPDLAVAVARRGLRELRGDASRAVPLWGLVVEGLLAADDVDGAAAAAAEMAEVADRTDSGVLRAEALLAGGRVAAAGGELDAAVEALQAVERQLPQQARPLLRADAGVAAAEVLAAMGDRAAAVAEARAALATYERLGAARRADRTAALLRRLGSPGRTGRRAAPDRVAALTGREREVLELVRAGLGNAAIAARLCISPKTAEHHVGHILTKLGVRTRAEAVAVAAAAASTSSPGGDRP